VKKYQRQAIIRAANTVGVNSWLFSNEVKIKLNQYHWIQDFFLMTEISQDVLNELQY
jgi:hypothetical protein